MRLYDPKTERWVDLPDGPGKLAEYIGAGYLPKVQSRKLDSGATERFINIADQEGRVANIPEQHFLGYIKKNPQIGLATDEQTFMSEGLLGRGAAKAVGDLLSLPGAGAYTMLLGPAAAALPLIAPRETGAEVMGMASGLSFGFSDAALAALDPDYVKNIEATAGGTKLKAELATIVGQGFLTGGAATGARTPGILNAVKGLASAEAPAARTATRGAKGLWEAIRAPTPVGISMRAQEAIGAKLTRELVGRGGLGTVGKLAARAGVWGTIGAADAGLWGVAQALEEKNLGDPRTFGEVLTAEVGSAAMAGAAFGAGASVLTDLFGAAFQRVAGGTARKLERMASAEAVGPSGQQVSELQLVGRTVADEALLQNGVTGRQLQELKARSEDYMQHLFDMDVLEDGSVFTRRVGDRLEDVRQAEVGPRLQRAKDLAGAEVGAHALRADDMAGGLIPANQAKAEAEAMLNAEAALQARDATTEARNAARAARHANADAAKAYPYVTVWDLADAIDNRVAELGSTTADDPIRNFLRENLDRYRWGSGRQGVKRNALWTYEEVIRERSRLHDAWKRLFNTDDVSKAAAHRELWRAFDDALRAKTDDFMPELRQTWDKANQRYSGLATIGSYVAGVVQKAQAVESVMGAFRQTATIGAWRSAAMMGMLGRSLVSPLRAGALGGALGATAGAGGALAGVAVGAGLAQGLKYMLPETSKFARIGYQVARNKHLVEQTAAVTKAVDEAVAQWLRRAQVRTTLTPIIGSQVVGGTEGSRKQMRDTLRVTSRLMQSPDAMATHVAMVAAPLAATHPETAHAYAQSRARQVAAVHRALMEALPQDRLNTFQPALARDFDQAPDSAVDHAGLKIAAALNPVQTMREIMAGIATEDQIQVFMEVYPQLYKQLLESIALRLAMHEEEIDGAQRAVLLQLGLNDSVSPPGQAGFAQGMMQQRGGQRLPMSAYGQLGKMGPNFATRDQARSRADGVV
jgi:hypothetical protein